MTDADTVREYIERAGVGSVLAEQDALAALDALVAERDRALENVRVREASQIPMIPRAAQERLEAAEAEVARLREALAVYADHRHWGIEREFRYPRAVWIGPGADQTVPDAPGVARAALGEEA